MAVLISIKTNPKFQPARALVSACMQVGVIGVGVLADSPAMQWSGFFALIIVGLAAAVMSNQKDTGLTIEQARARLDDIESLDQIRVEFDYGL